MAEQDQNAGGSQGSYFVDKARREQELTQQKMNGIYPLLIVSLYLVLGFMFHLWHPGWLIFFAIPIYYMQPKTKLQKLGNPVMITLIYLVLGFFFHLWHPGWLIFLVIPVAAILDKAEVKSN